MEKICNKCLLSKNVNLFSRRPLKSGKMSYRHWCKSCTSSFEKARVRERVGDVQPLVGLPNELWREVVGFAGYEVSSHGRLASFAKSNRVYKTLLNPILQKTGYRSQPLYYGESNKFKRISVHRLVATAFLPNPENKPCVNHINHNRADNRVENLEWCTWKENLAHAKKHGRMQRGEARYNNALSEAQVLQIYNSTKAQRPLAKEYNVNQGTVAKIKTGQNWGHITGKKYVAKYSKHKS